MVFLGLRLLKHIPWAKDILRHFFSISHPSLERKVFGINFPNPIGLAAGMDKDAEAFEMLSCMGFGFIEIGTLTPLPQPGNEKPRVFRLKKDQALINRMGFNNRGVDYAIENLKNKPSNLIVGGNIGKNKLTANEDAIGDYLVAFKKLHPYVDYFVVNVSSPNTPNLRDLQEKEPLKQLLNALTKENDLLERQRPILLKIAPDLSNSQLDDIIEIVDQTGIAGVVATNTTIERNGLSYDSEFIEGIGPGGLSGRVLRKRSTEVVSYLHKKSNGKFPIIAVGGIFTARDAMEKLEAGAALVQVYTGFVYEGPIITKKINQLLIKDLDKNVN